MRDNPLWYKDTIIYELHVRSFYDSNADGIGDFKGLIKKLDYLSFLGVGTIWLLPFYPSPLRDEGYDIADYMTVNPDYGSLRDFKQFLREAHKHNIRVMTELVLNHTSDQHQWFQQSRHAKAGDKMRDFYVWSDNADKYREARIIFKDFETSNWTWDPVAKSYFWHRFYSHQPDLNYDNPRVQKEILRIVNHWLEMGVDGLRLDAVPYLFQREKTNCENLPETHEFLRTIRQHIDKKFKDRVILAEANQWPEDAVSYFGNDDECHMAFHFPIMPRLFMSLNMEDRFPLVDIYEQTPEIPENSQWALFLRNHDELTLEMVTDEERDYMYRMYARDPHMRINDGIRRRLATLINNDRKKIELMNGLLLSLSGTPIIYYGDEIGMGDNYYLGDRNGVRTPMQWSSNKNAGFSDATPQKLYLPVIIDPEYNYETINVENQINNSQSLLWWMKRIIALRKQYESFGRGSIEFLLPDNRKIIVYTREYGDETILIVANLSRYPQFSELDLSKYKGYVPKELFGQNDFPLIGEDPYFLSLSGYAFFWFALEKTPEEGSQEIQSNFYPSIAIKKDWFDIFKYPDLLNKLTDLLKSYLKTCRWYGYKTNNIKSISVEEKLFLPRKDIKAVIILLSLEIYECEPQSYWLALTVVEESEIEDLKENYPQSIIAQLCSDDNKYYLIDALYYSHFNMAILAFLTKPKRLKGENGNLFSMPQKKMRHIKTEIDGKEFNPIPLKVEQSNISIIYNEKLIVKFFRRFDVGVNPDFEVGKFLSKSNFKNISPLAGGLEYRNQFGVLSTLAIAQEYVKNEGDAWNYTLDFLNHYFEEALTIEKTDQIECLPLSSLLTESNLKTPAIVNKLVSVYLELGKTLGQRTGALHCQLASTQDARFIPESFSVLDKHSLYQSIRSLFEKVTKSLEKGLKNFPEKNQVLVKKILEKKDYIQKFTRKILTYNLSGLKMHCHGDYHLGQILCVGNDFFIIDFEGEPSRPLSERYIKRSPLKDVAGMLRSFHYAATTVSQQFLTQQPGLNENDLSYFAGVWYRWVSFYFLKGYIDATQHNKILPNELPEFLFMLKLMMLEKAIYELNYELNNRPNWLFIPCQGLLDLITELEN